MNQTTVFIFRLTYPFGHGSYLQAIKHSPNIVGTPNNGLVSYPDYGLAYMNPKYENREKEKVRRMKEIKEN